MLPVRCFTCNKVLGHLSDDVENYGKSIDTAFYDLHCIKRYCCRKVLATSVDIYKEDLKPRDESFYKIKKYVEVTKIVSTV